MNVSCLETTMQYPTVHEINGTCYFPLKRLRQTTTRDEMRIMFVIVICSKRVYYRQEH